MTDPANEDSRPAPGYPSVGREGGRFSMEEMTELKWITIQSGQRAFPI
jgi:hypothetical protein